MTIKSNQVMMMKYMACPILRHGLYISSLLYGLWSNHTQYDIKIPQPGFLDSQNKTERQRDHVM